MNYTQPEVYEYISKQTNDPIVERKTCSVSGTTFAIFQSDLEFYEKISPTFNGKKYLIPTPTLCPEERMRERILFRNELNFFRRRCDATNESLISQYPPIDTIKVFKNDVRRAGEWEQVQVQVDDPFSNSFEESMAYLLRETPKPHMSVTTDLVNSLYANNSSDIKDCYMVASANECEQCFYCLQPWYSTDCIDCLMIYHCRHCYELIDSYNCQNCQHSIRLKNCVNCRACSDCENCTDCLGCTNLVNKQFCIENEQYTADEYKELCQDYVQKQHISGIVRDRYQLQCEQVIGNYIENSKNLYACYDVHDCEDCKYINNGKSYRRCMDISYFGIEVHDSYQCCIVGIDSSRLLFCRDTYENCSDLIYCYQCHTSQNCFGCVGLRNKQYCIFNKQYTKEDYENIVGKLIEQMIEEGSRGAFFHPILSPFGYNQTVAMDYFSLSKEEVTRRGYNRSESSYDVHIPDGVPTIYGSDLPDHIDDVNDSILNKILLCQKTNKPFRIIRQELDFYRKHNLPLPRVHPEIRHKERLEKRPGRTLYARTCDRCDNEILSVYDESEGKHIYCETCYQKAVYA